MFHTAHIEGMHCVFDITSWVCIGYKKVLYKHLTVSFSGMIDMHSYAGTLDLRLFNMLLGGS